MKNGVGKKIIRVLHTYGQSNIFIIKTRKHEELCCSFQHHVLKILQPNCHLTECSAMVKEATTLMSMGNT